MTSMILGRPKSPHDICDLCTTVRVSPGMPATMADNTDNEQMLLEGVVYYVDPKSVGTLAFLGGKERIRIPITSTHSSLEALRRHIIEYAGLKAESEKRGLGSCIELKLCRLAKSAEGSKAYAINTQAQWDEERPLFLKSPSTTALQGEQLFLIFARVCEWSLKDAKVKAAYILFWFVTGFRSIPHYENVICLRLLFSQN